MAAVTPEELEELRSEADAGWVTGDVARRLCAEVERCWAEIDALGKEVQELQRRLGDAQRSAPGARWLEQRAQASVRTGGREGTGDTPA